MLIRTISAIIYLLVVLPCIYFSNTPVFVVFVFLLSVGAIFEMIKCNGLQRNIGISAPAYLISLMPILPRLLGTDLFYKVSFPFIFLSAFILLIVYTLMRNKPELGKVIITWFFSAYATAGFTALILLADLRDGAWHIMFLAFIASWITDTFALITGMLFGKHKLLPRVSPKKTIEGAIGGTIFCVLAFLLYARILEVWFDYEIASYIMIAVCGLVCALVAVVGDLLFSAVKRDAGIKDFGKLMPGHGGILDRFDSLISISLVLLMFITSTNLF